MFWFIVIGIVLGIVLINRTKIEKRRSLARIQELENQLMGARYACRVLEGRLCNIRGVTIIAMENSPYRSSPERLVGALSDIRDVVDQHMLISCHEVSCFGTLRGALQFLKDLPPCSNSYIVPCRQWDGDCYHVIYSTQPAQKSANG